jgi:phosphoglycerol transferase MdoB-like AlkP superfamily enzyme
MEPESEYLLREKIQNEIRNLQRLETLVSWTRIFVLLGGAASSVWLIYHTFAAYGFLVGLIAFVGLSVIYTISVPFMFTAAATILSFYFQAIGIWLPITSYALALLLMYGDIRSNQLRQRVDIYRLALRRDSALGMDDRFEA